MKMKRPFLFRFFFLVMLYPVHSEAQTPDSSNLPIIILNTYGQTIPDDPRITIFMGIIDNGFGYMNHVSDPYNGYNGEVTIEIRGSTSQQYPKRSYAFTPVDSAGNAIHVDMLGLPPEKDWILYAPYPDKTLMRNTLAYYLARRMGHYSSRTCFAEVVRNGSYRGVYELQEKIKRDANRVDIAHLTAADSAGDELTGGYIIKIDKTTGAGTDTFVSSFDPDVFFQFHDPKDVNLLPAQKNYIVSYVDSFETALMSPWFADPDSGYRKYAGEGSFIDFFLLQELGHTVDGYRSSCFLYKDKDSKGGKLNMGPMWDFNLSFGNADYCDAYDTTGWQYQFNSTCSGYVPHVPFWWNRMIQDPVYQNNLRCRWEDLRRTFLHSDSVNAWIDSVAAYLDAAQQRNFTMWPILGVYVNWNYYIGQTYSDEVNYLKTWIEKRSVWLDHHIPGICSPVGIAGNQQEASFQVSPNPSAGLFSLYFHEPVSEGSIVIVNQHGEVVWNGSLHGERQKEIRLESAAAGMYCIKVTGGGRVLVRKILVE